MFCNDDSQVLVAIYVVDGFATAMELHITNFLLRVPNEHNLCLIRINGHIIIHL